MNTTSRQLDQSAPRLAAPGAGLPLPELLIARLRFWIARRSKSAEDFMGLFQSERTYILQLASECSDHDAARQVLIKRLRGMEDSSRDWSVFMTLNHLSIVNGGVIRTIQSLLRGVIPDGKVGTADVKPAPKSDAGSLESFERVCDLYIKSVNRIPDLKTAVRYRHPWFGPMDAFSWHALAAVHMRIHRQQIELIVAQLGNDNPG